MREAGSKLEIPLHVFGPETHMTAVVGMALGKRPLPKPSPGLAPQNVSTCTSTCIQNIISFKLKMPLKARSCSLHPFLFLSLSSSIFLSFFFFSPFSHFSSQSLQPLLVTHWLRWPREIVLHPPTFSLTCGRRHKRRPILLLLLSSLTRQSLLSGVCSLELFKAC